MNPLLTLLAVFAVAAGGCTDSARIDIDGSAVDGSAVDSTGKDSAGKDSAGTDTGTSDTSPAEMGIIDAGPDAAIGCPAAAPALSSACAPEGERCTYSPRPECGTILECLDSAWVAVHQTDCAGAPSGVCDDDPPGGFCNAGNPLCIYDDLVCSCSFVCTGMQPPPGQEYAYQCAPPPPAACPQTSPAQGEACKREGLECVYGTCGGQIASCAGGTWQVKMIPPPP